MRKNFEESFVTPLPVLMIGTYNEDGSVNIPKVLWPYMGGKKKLEKVK